MKKPSKAKKDQPQIFTVSEITHEIKSVVESSFSSFWMVGEISNLSCPRSGHIYLTLKDSKAQIGAAIWRSAASKIRFQLENGQAVLVMGRLSVYPPHGKYQLIIDKIEPKGIGALQLAFQQLKEKLEKEGLFNSEIKKPLPFLPRHIGIITSPTGAAIKDILSVLKRRFHNVKATLYPVRVQGKGSEKEIADALAAMNGRGDFDVLIVGRGGGSIEDLWAFNEEVVARAIFASRIPVISAVGHETDITISDLVADRRALTPTEAAEIVIPIQEELYLHLRQKNDSMRNALNSRISEARLRVKACADSYALRQPIELIRQKQQRIDELTDRVSLIMRHRMTGAKEHWTRMAEILESLSPLKVLGRGYSITTCQKDGKVLRDATTVKPGEQLKTILHTGNIVSEVISTGLKKNFLTQG